MTDSAGKFTTTITSSHTPGLETITATSRRPVPLGSTLPPPSGSAVLIERGMTLSFEPASIPADGSSTSTATATVYRLGDLSSHTGDKR